jgi:hypothetical protein
LNRFGASAVWTADSTAIFLLTFGVPGGIRPQKLQHAPGHFVSECSTGHKLKVMVMFVVGVRAAEFERPRNNHSRWEFTPVRRKDIPPMMTNFGFSPGVLDYWMLLTDWRNGSFAILLALGVLLVGYTLSTRYQIPAAESAKPVEGAPPILTPGEKQLPGG